MARLVSVEEFFEGFQNCERHCWCTYKVDEFPEYMVIIQGFKEQPHDHGEEGRWCVGCCLESGKITFNGESDRAYV